MCLGCKIYNDIILFTINCQKYNVLWKWAITEFLRFSSQFRGMHKRGKSLIYPNTTNSEPSSYLRILLTRLVTTVRLFWCWRNCGGYMNLETIRIWCSTDWKYRRSVICTTKPTPTQRVNGRLNIFFISVRFSFQSRLYFHAIFDDVMAPISTEHRTQRLYSGGRRARAQMFWFSLQCMSFVHGIAGAELSTKRISIL